MVEEGGGRPNEVEEAIAPTEVAAVEWEGFEVDPQLEAAGAEAEAALAHPGTSAGK